ncbi:MAG: MarR family transcriptional regulator [Propionibacteriaceae bacterium]
MLVVGPRTGDELITETNQNTRTEPSPAEQLADQLRALWQALVRATRTAEQLPSLPEAQVAVLRKLVASDGLSPAQLAAELHLARPTISNLVPELTAEGLVERRPSPLDGRSVLLVPTDRARDVLAAFSRGRVQVLARALDQVPPTDRRRLVEALPALELLLDRLETMSEAPPREAAPS